MTAILAVLSTSDAVALYTKILNPTQAAWVTSIVTLLTLVMGRFTHKVVTPLADPKNNAGAPLVVVGNAPSRLVP